MELIWQDFLKIAETELGIRAVETWIKAVSFYRYQSSQQFCKRLGADALQ